jgi:hypothetical protein
LSATLARDHATFLEKSAQYPLRKIIKRLSFAQVAGDASRGDDTTDPPHPKFMAHINASTCPLAPRCAPGVGASMKAKSVIGAPGAAPGLPPR